jgi:aminopeptidase C
MQRKPATDVKTKKITEIKASGREDCYASNSSLKIIFVICLHLQVFVLASNYDYTYHLKFF